MGKRSVNVLPLPDSVCTSIVPPCSAARLAREPEAYADPAVLARKSGIELNERLEEFRQVFRRNADAGVGHGDFKPPDGAPRAHRDGAAVAVELYRVVDKRIEHATQRVQVEFRAAGICGHIELNPDTARFRGLALRGQAIGGVLLVFGSKKN